MGRFFLSALIIAGSVYAAESAKIVIREGKKTVEIALDSKNVPRVDGDQKSYPTIKDFRTGSDYDEFCYEGAETKIKDLVTALVDAADGDGDSYATVRSLKVDKKTRIVKVAASITDESGEKEESFTFKPCL